MLALLLAVSVGHADGYARPELLLDPALLAAQPNDFIVLDVRDAKAYAAGHVPRARRADPAEWAKAFGDGSDLAGWLKRLAPLGVTADAKIVVYDDAKSKDAARAWWILKYYGVADVRVLNGGWHEWRAGQHPVSTDAPPAAELKYFVPKPQTARLAEKADVLQSLPGQTLQVFDARSEGEYCGHEALKNKKAGRIPGAKHLEWSELIDPTTHRFLPATALKAKLAAAGIALDQPTVTHCQAGGRASVAAFVMELMGTNGVKNYLAGWGEWGNADDTPVATGK